MPPGPTSRYLFCQQLTDEQGRIYLSEREPFLYEVFEDTILHTVRQGDTLWSLAEKYLGDASLWWVIADFQPDGPINDPTILLATTSVLHVPSRRVLAERIFSPSRADE